ncbi:MAG: hypothetical protein JKX69_02445 [Rhodobacteraceae bacterium]|nr:hypothetical protein [Paracoccaceae bacterium]
MTPRVIFVGLLWAAPLAAQDLVGPSGLKLDLFEVLIEEAPQIARLRYVATGVTDFEQVSADFAWLCQNHALPALRQNGWQGAQVVISIASEIRPFGEFHTEIIQFFEGYRPDGDTCIWEAF